MCVFLLIQCVYCGYMCICVEPEFLRLEMNCKIVEYNVMLVVIEYGMVECYVSVMLNKRIRNKV